MSESSPLLAIKCLAYNHEPYIRQCLDGFVMQKTDFPFIAIVHDDASTDKTADIIREYAEKYPDIIKPIFESENQYSKRNGSIRRIINNAIPLSVKYIALCEGDDYWIDPYKIQKQVDVMNANPNIVLSHTAFQYDKNNKVCDSQNEIQRIKQTSRDDLLYNILKNNTYRIQTCTTVLRKDAYYKSCKNLSQQPNFMMGDTPLWVNILQLGEIHFLEDITSGYRINNTSVTRPHNLRSRLRFVLSSCDMRLYYSKYLNLPRYQQKYFEQIYRKAFLDYIAFDPQYDKCMNYEKIHISSMLLLIRKIHLQLLYWLRNLKRLYFDK